MAKFLWVWALAHLGHLEKAEEILVRVNIELQT
jgi:hypothetical protein